MQDCFFSFLLAYLPCVLCVATSQGFTPYFHHCPYSYHRCLLPPTSTIAICSHLPTPTYFCNCCLLLPTCSHLLAPACFCHCYLLLPLSHVLVSCLLLPTSSPTSTIATYMFSPSLTIPTYFHHCCVFRLLTCFYLLHHLLAYPCGWHV